MIRKYCVLLVLSIGMGQPNHAVHLEAPAEIERARSILEALESKFDQVRSLEYSVHRVTMSRRQSNEERWRILLGQEGFIRLDYEKPVARLVTVNREEAWEYIPAARRAMRTSLSEKSDAERLAFARQFLERVAIEGIRLGASDHFLSNFLAVHFDEESLNRAIIEGDSPRYLLEIDVDRNVLIRCEFYNDQGRLTMRAEATQFHEVIDGFWHPSTIIISQQTDDGYVNSRVNISRIRINESLGDDRFQFTPPRGVEVIGM